MPTWCLKFYCLLDWGWAQENSVGWKLCEGWVCLLQLPLGCFSCACTRIPSLIPVAFVQSLANLNFLNKRFPFLHPVIKIVSSALHTHLDDSSIFMLLSDAWTGKGIILEHQSTLLSQHVDRPVEYQTIFVTYFCVLFRHVHTLHTERKHKGVLNWATLV